MKGPWGSEVEAFLPFLYVTESVFSSRGFKRCLQSQWQALMRLLPLMLLALSRYVHVFLAENFQSSFLLCGGLRLLE